MKIQKLSLSCPGRDDLKAEISSLKSKGKRLQSKCRDVWKKHLNKRCIANTSLQKGFTLVELIVVITILAVLSTIGFVSYSGYLAGTRDAARIASLKAISEGLELYSTRHNLPNPDEATTQILDNGTQIATQGYVGKNVLETITYSTEGTDPKDGTYYSYYLTRDKKYFQLMAFLEEEENLNSVAFNPPSPPLEGGTTPLLSKEGLGVVYAVDYSTRYPKVFGKKLGILVDSNNTPIQELTGSLDISDVGDLKLKAYLKYYDYLTGTGTTFQPLATFAKVGGKFCSSNNLQCANDWRAQDSNCYIPDIIIGNQTWAGCNSTIGDGIIYNTTNECYDYLGNKLDNDICNGYNSKEIEYNSTYGIDNIWGKMYTFDNAKNACGNGYHLPSDDEWTELENTLYGSVCRTTTDLECEGLGWKDHKLKDSTNNLINALLLPLSGYNTYYKRGDSLSIWTSTEDPSDNTKGFNRYSIWSLDTIGKYSYLKTILGSVRCIKD